MNAWSLRRRRIVLFIVLFFLFILVALPAFFFFYRAPSCTDGKQDGDESGVDCGGSCQLLCAAQSLPLISKGDARVLQISTSTYEVVAYLENPNVSAEIYRAPYKFQIYEASSTIPLKVITGSTYIPPNTDFAVFEGPFTLNASSTLRAVFNFDPVGLVWKKTENIPPSLSFTDQAFTNGSTSARLSETVTNRTLKPVFNIDLIALLFDQSGTIVGAGKTFIDSLTGGESSPVVFSWPHAFTTNPVSIIILQRIFPDRSFLH